jgi:hypothetical protein
MSEESRVANAAVLLLSAEVDTSPTKIQPAIQVAIITSVVNRRMTGLQGGHTDRSQRQRVGIHPDTAQSDQGAADGATLARNSPQGTDADHTDAACRRPEQDQGSTSGALY